MSFNRGFQFCYEKSLATAEMSCTHAAKIACKQVKFQAAAVQPVLTSTIENGVYPYNRTSAGKQCLHPCCGRFEALRGARRAFPAGEISLEQEMLPRDGLGLPQVLGGKLPIDQFADYRVDIICPAVLVIEVVGMLPDIDGNKRLQSCRQGRVGIWRFKHLELIPR